MKLYRNDKERKYITMEKFDETIWFQIKEYCQKSFIRVFIVYNFQSLITYIKCIYIFNLKVSKIWIYTAWFNVVFNLVYCFNKKKLNLTLKVTQIN